MTPRFLIHPGYPKCGSTSLQANAFAQHPELHYMSCHSAPGDAFRDAPETSEFYTLLRHHDDPARIRTLWNNHMRPAAREDRLNVISDETFLNNEGPSAEIVATLRELVGEAQVLIVLRDQTDILRSLYDMYPWEKGDPDRRFLKFSDWLARLLDQAEDNIASALRYRTQIDLYRATFGDAAVTVISVEKLFKDAEAQQVLCARLGIDAAQFRALLTQPAANTYSDHASKKLVRRILGPVRGSSFLSPGQIKLIRKILARLLPQKRTMVSANDLTRIDTFFAGHRPGDLHDLSFEGLLL